MTRVQASKSSFIVALAVSIGGCGSSDAASGATLPEGGTRDAGASGGSTQGTGGSATGGRTSKDAGAGGTAGAAGSAGPGDAADAGRFKKNPALTGLADETALDLGQFQCTDVEGEDPGFCRQTTDYSGFVYDPHHHAMLLYGGGHATTMTDSIHVLDLAGSLKWADLYPPTPCSQMTTQNLDTTNGAWLAGTAGPYPRPVSTHTYDMLAVAPLIDEFIVIARTFTGGTCNPVGNDIGGHVAHFLRDTAEWSFSPTADGSTYELTVNIPASEPDPVSGKIVLVSNGGLSIYEPATRMFTHVSDTLNTSAGPQADLASTGYANHMVYFPPEDRFYYFSRKQPVEVYALKFDRNDPSASTIDPVATTGPTSTNGEPGYAYDATNHVIGGAVQDDTFYVFDPATKTWTSHAMKEAPGSMAFHSIGYDPVDNVFVFITDYNSGRKTWAYRLKN